MYAAEHGHWPETLDVIKKVPVPLDPWLQKPFEYSVNDGIATLQPPLAPLPPGGLGAISRFELTLRQPDSTRSHTEGK